MLEQELNLPFSFVSGHIHELLIHVPWTRLTSEPVQITINTIGISSLLLVVISATLRPVLIGICLKGIGHVLLYRQKTTKF